MSYTSRTETVLVTGCSSGFGYETAILLARRGYRVFATMRRPEAGERLRAAAAGAPGEVVVRRLDVTDGAQIEAVVSEAADRGDLEAVVNNAGIGISGFFEDLSDGETRAVLETNLFGLVAVTRAALPHLTARRRGTVVQIASTAGRIAGPGTSAYAASKHAVEGFSKALRHELRPLGIRVVLIEPGTFRTEILGANWRLAARLASGESPNVPAARRYAAAYGRMFRWTAGDPRRVANLVARVAESPRPRLRYPIGVDAKPLLFLGERLPGSIYEGIVAGGLRATGYPSQRRGSAVGYAPRPKPVAGKMRSTPVTHRTETVLVTGCSSGFGYETALLLARRGYRVFATMRRPEAGERLRAAAAGAPGEVMVRRLDVTDGAQIEAVVSEAADRGDLEAVVNNAGIGIVGFLEDLCEEEIRSTFETNFFGLAAMTRTSLPHLKERGRGTIVQVSSIGGRIGLPAFSAYQASKHAVEGFSKALRHELRPLGIRVVLIEPGAFRTEIFGKNERIAERLESGESPNTAAFNRVVARVNSSVARFGGNPARVAGTIVRAIEAPRPRLRYSLGPDAKPMLLVGECLPYGIFERGVARVLRAGGYPPGAGGG